MARHKIAFAAITALALLVASQPVSAGVGGCRPIAGVGGCPPGGWNLTSQETDTRTPSFLDYSRGAIPVQMAAFLRAMLSERTGGTDDDGGLVAAPDDLTTAGVGGCRPLPGVGGCTCFGGIC